MVQLHNLKLNKKNKTKKRVGRGGKRGTYSGRGLKGQKARAGRKIKPEIREVIKRIPKKRGYRFKSIKTPAEVVNLGKIESKFKDGGEVNLKTLLENKLIGKIKSRVKILGMGKLTKKLTFSECEVSSSAKEKIEKVGGEVSTINK